MIFYFTATGNSLYVAQSLDARCISIAQAIHNPDKTYTDEKIGIVCPVYGHEMPELVKEFLARSTFHTDYFYVILTYGKMHGGAAELAKAYLDEIGLHASYINVLLMVDNYLPAFDMDEEIALDKHVDEQIETIKHDMEAKKEMIAPVTDEDRKIHQYYMEHFGGNDPDRWRDLYRITDACIGCGICEKVCPKACYTVEGQKSHWDPDGCIACMACVHACPMKAIQLTIPEKNPEARYRNENIALSQIISANNQH